MKRGRVSDDSETVSIFIRNESPLRSWGFVTRKKSGSWGFVTRKKSGSWGFVTGTENRQEESS